MIIDIPEISITPVTSGTSITDQTLTKSITHGHKGVDELEYYHGLLPRDDIVSLLVNEGDFLLRTTELVSGANRTICISVFWRENIRHFPCKANMSGKYNIDENMQFDTIIEMLTYYMSENKTFSSHFIKLQTPIVRQSWEHLHSQVTLEKKLGEGAFGDVFVGFLKIKDYKEPIRVAIKTMKCSSQTKEKIEIMMREARIMRGFNHKNIIHCYGVAAEIEPLYIIMEIMDKGALDSYMRDNNVKVTVEERMQMIYDAASGLEYIHSKSIMHCDISARNCLYGNRIVKLSDFGLSRKVENNLLASTDRTPVRWTAPEVFTKRTYTKASDIWAFGVLIWEIFNNAQEPYSGMTIMEVKNKVINGTYKLELPKWAPKDLQNLLLERIFIIEPIYRARIHKIRQKLREMFKTYKWTMRSNSLNLQSVCLNPNNRNLKEKSHRHNKFLKSTSHTSISQSKETQLLTYRDHKKTKKSQKKNI